jgi:glycosyltransferase involved in cell wall biosynthesis
MKIVTFTTLYPNAVQKNHGVFVENRIRHLVNNTKVQSIVIAPVPWFPFKNSVFGQYARYAKVPKQEKRSGIKILHPKYPLIPKIGMSITPFLMALSLVRMFRKLHVDGYKFDLIDAHYFYPDGVAAVILGKLFKIPVVITARGTDLNLIPKYKLPRTLIKWAANNSRHMITVCQALKDILIQLGVEDKKVKVLRNGVDLVKFSPPQDRNSLRKQLNIRSKALLSVGLLISRKGHDLVVKALANIPDTVLFIAGDGPEKGNLTRLVSELGLENRVIFLGEISHDKLSEYYGAVDALILASSREGWANVLLESMASGTPVVATNVWGTPEVVACEEAGVLVDRNVESITQGIVSLLENYPDRNKTRAYAEQFSWDSTTKGQLALFEQIADEAR